jgi:hypothetical protein
MFNFIVTGCEGAWDGNPYELDLDRLGEYTNHAIAEKYKKLTDAAISELLSFHSLFAYEQVCNLDAQVGFVKQIKRRSSQILIEYEFNSDLPTIPTSELIKLCWELDIEIKKLEMFRTHWAIKDVNLLQVLVEANLISKEQLRRIPWQLVKFSPQVLQNKTAIGDFDVFLCHNSRDNLLVKEIGMRLKENGISPWLDEWELRPGLSWQRVLEEQIEKIKSAAVFIGKNGFSPWEDIEVEAFLREFVKRKCPVIPVILNDCIETPKLPIFLGGKTWVDFRKKDPDPLEQLLWGITGKRKGI